MRIESTDDTLQEDFCQYLIEVLQDLIITSVRQPRKELIAFGLPKYQEFINSKDFPLTDRIYGVKHLDIKTILIQGALNLRYRKCENNYQIEIDKNQLIPGTFIHLIEICKLVDYGNLELKGLRIFDEAFKNVETNISKYIDMFQS